MLDQRLLRDNPELITEQLGLLDLAFFLGDRVFTVPPLSQTSF